MATHAASPKPMTTRRSDALMCCQSVPFSISSQVPLTTAHGVGKMRLPVTITAAHQRAMSATMTASDGSDALRRYMITDRCASETVTVPDMRGKQARAPVQFVRPPGEFRPGRRRIRNDADDHLTARVRTAGEGVNGRLLKRQPKALSRHHQR